MNKLTNARNVSMLEHAGQKCDLCRVTI